jgi:hypothetical protein
MSVLDVFPFTPSKPCETAWTDEGGRVDFRAGTGKDIVRFEGDDSRFEERFTVRFPNSVGLGSVLRTFLKEHRLGFLHESPDRAYSETSENFTYTGSETFALAKKFVNDATIVVTVDGAPEADWSLSGNNTAPLITPGGTFATGAVVVTYRFRYQVRAGVNPLRSSLHVPGALPSSDATVEVFEIDPGGHLV